MGWRPAGSANRSRLNAELVTGYVPTASLPDQRNVTPRFQSVPALFVIATGPSLLRIKDLVRTIEQGH